MVTLHHTSVGARWAINNLEIITDFYCAERGPFSLAGCAHGWARNLWVELYVHPFDRCDVGAPGHGVQLGISKPKYKPAG